MEFKVGDVVDWCGIIGEVIGNDTSNTYLNVRFRHECGHVLDEVFYIDGLYRTYHKEPSLKLIEKSKKKVKKYKVLFKGVTVNGERGF